MTEQHVFDRLNTPQQQRICLSVVWGLQEGARVMLPLGIHTVGSSEDCDFVLHDPAGKAARHFRLHVTPQSVTLIPERDGVLVDDRPVGSGRKCALTVDAPTDVQIGANIRVRIELGKHNEGFIPGMDPHDSPIETRPVRSKNAWIGPAVVIGCAAAGAVTWSGLTNWHAFGKPASQLRSPGDDELRARLLQLRLDELRVVRGSSGDMLVAGYVTDSQALVRAQEAITEPEVRWQVNRVDEMLRLARDWIQELGLDAEVSYGGAGVIELAGTPPNAPKLLDAAQRASAHIPGLGAARVRIIGNDSALNRDDQSRTSSATTASVPGFTGVNSGHSLPFITSSGGSYTFEGGALRNGMGVVRIGQDRVVVTQPELKSQ